MVRKRKEGDESYWRGKARNWMKYRVGKNREEKLREGKESGRGQSEITEEEYSLSRGKVERESRDAEGREQGEESQ